MSYQVKEIYYTLQGEGAKAGSPAVFLRFAGCNLWSGLESDRADAKCYFCDTDFVGTNGTNGGKYSDPKQLAEKIEDLWPGGGSRLVVCTGGEPLLQLDEDLLNALKAYGFEIAVETNGTILAPEGIDWITVSPKPNSSLKQVAGNELKLVYPQRIDPKDLENLKFDNFYLMPLEEPSESKSLEHMKSTVKYCLENPFWKLTIQTHKILGIR